VGTWRHLRQGYLSRGRQGPLECWLAKATHLGNKMGAQVQGGSAECGVGRGKQRALDGPLCVPLSWLLLAVLLAAAAHVPGSHASTWLCVWPAAWPCAERTVSVRG